LAQVELQRPPLQLREATFVAAQARPHAPQLNTSELVFASQPFATFMSQSPKPGAHWRMHAPETQDGVAFTVLQALSQAPQLDASARRFTSQPSLGLLSQSAKPVLQDMIAHCPVAHELMALVSTHGSPHEPQFVVVLRGVSQPSV
jgi:hypothetical protein